MAEILYGDDQSERFQMLDLGDCVAGDVLIADTASGGKIKITLLASQDVTHIPVILSQRDTVKSAAWDGDVWVDYEPGIRFWLVGSCTGYRAGATIIDGRAPGVLSVDTRAWFERSEPQPQWGWVEITPQLTSLERVRELETPAA